MSDRDRAYKVLPAMTAGLAMRGSARKCAWPYPNSIDIRNGYNDQWIKL